MTIRRHVFSLIVLCLPGLGCQGRGLPAQTPGDAGQAALISALDAWKGGATLQSLRDGRPPIHVADEDWLAEYVLTDFRIDGEPRSHGGSVAIPVHLSLTDPQGRQVEREVVYTVATQPRISIVRQD